MTLKGSFISESFSLWLKSQKKRQITTLVDSAQYCDLAPFLGDLSQSEKSFWV
jgi:hypothetical protein